MIKRAVMAFALLVSTTSAAIFVGPDPRVVEVVSKIGDEVYVPVFSKDESFFVIKRSDERYCKIKKLVYNNGLVFAVCEWTDRENILRMANGQNVVFTWKHTVPKYDVKFCDRFKCRRIFFVSKDAYQSAVPPKGKIVEFINPRAFKNFIFYDCFKKKKIKLKGRNLDIIVKYAGNGFQFYDFLDWSHYVKVPSSKKCYHLGRMTFVCKHPEAQTKNLKIELPRKVCGWWILTVYNTSSRSQLMTLKLK